MREADMAAGTCGVNGLHHGFLRADSLDDGVGSKTAGNGQGALDPIVPALLDDVGGSELPGESLTVGVSTEGDDSFYA